MVSEFDQRIWRLAVLALLMFAVFALASGCAQHARGQANDAPTGKQPNFVFILADDVGITDINAYSRELLQAEASEQFYKTPNLDSLARDGIAFEQAYATQLCSPTRAALLTGRFAPRLGFTTATPPTRTYFSAGLAAPADEMPLDTIEQKTNVDIMTPLESGHSQTALPTGHPLFDIEADPFERNDLSGARAEISERLFAELEVWLRENVEPQYFPRTSTRYIPSQDPRGTALDGKDLIAEKEAQLAR